MENLFYFGSLLIAAIVVFRYYRSSDTDSDWNAVAKHEQQFDRWQAWIKRHIDNDQMPQIICGSSPLCHDADEEVVAVLPSVDLLEPRAVRYSRSYYGGPTIRIAKGLSLRLGAASGRSESQDELRTLDHGTLVLTTKRLAFMGSMRTNNVSLDDIVTVEPYADGIRLHRERKERPETYIFTRELKFADGSGADLSVSGGSFMTLIKLTKLAHQNPGVLGLARREQFPVQLNFNSDNRVIESPYVPFTPGASPLNAVRSSGTSLTTLSDRRGR